MCVIAVLVDCDKIIDCEILIKMSNNSVIVEQMVLVTGYLKIQIKTLVLITVEPVLYILLS